MGWYRMDCTIFLPGYGVLECTVCEIDEYNTNVYAQNLDRTKRFVIDVDYGLISRCSDVKIPRQLEEFNTASSLGMLLAFIDHRLTGEQIRKGAEVCGVSLKVKVIDCYLGGWLIRSSGEPSENWTVGDFILTFDGHFRNHTTTAHSE